MWGIYEKEDELNLKSGNCYKTYEEAEQRAKEIKVYTLLKNFSDANFGSGIDFTNFINSIKWKDERTKLEAIIRYKKEIEVLENE